MNPRQHRIGAAVAAVLLATAGILVITAAPAAAVPGVIRFLGLPSANDTDPDKGSTADCSPSAPRIVGGGILLNDGGQRSA